MEMIYSAFHLLKSCPVSLATQLRKLPRRIVASRNEVWIKTKFCVERNIYFIIKL